MASLGIEPVDPTQLSNLGIFLSDSPSTKSGYLFKTGQESKAWKKRYFRMKDNFIYYFKTNKTIIPSGSIPLQDAEIFPAPDQVNKKQFRFHLQTRHRTYNLAAEDQETALEWIESISDYITEKKKSGKSQPQLHSITIPDNFWENKTRVFLPTLKSPKNILAIFSKKYRFIIEKNKEYFFPILPVQLNSPEALHFYANCFKY